MPFDIRPKFTPPPSAFVPEPRESLPMPRHSEYVSLLEPRGRFQKRRQRLRWRWLLLAGFFLMLGMLPFVWHWVEGAEGRGMTGAREAKEAVLDLQASRWQQAEEHFRQARENFDSIARPLRPFGFLIDFTAWLPGLSRAASGRHLAEAGSALAAAGQELSQTLQSVPLALLASDNTEGISLLEILRQSHPALERLGGVLREAESHLAQVRLEDVPASERDQLRDLKVWLPTGLSSLELALRHETLFEELLGGRGPRKYLFLFQNNHELRPTGGFIGSYARLDLTDGAIRQFFIDGIFNPDGQLKENIVPPAPIQKISAGWSLHDSNWFPDFPVSAEKAIFFYEKTGGPTVDGVVTVTPTILERLLRITGPIELQEYGVTIDADNFMPIVQEEVEERYDRELNQPKKILADLASELFRRLLRVPSPERFRSVAATFVGGLNQRHILLYSRHPETQAIIDEAGWSGRLLPATHDYLAVIHANINGYKTDGVIDETITHLSEIEADGSIVDTVSIRREHRGGAMAHAWWNKVNADYLRVYVPLGAELLSAEGMTREFPKPPLDYDTLGFRRDPTVVAEEASIVIDPLSGTRIGQDAGKTVFGNWVYVSPGESVTVTYRYRLPFRLALSHGRRSAPIGYSVLYQKQAGTAGVKLNAMIKLPESQGLVWQTGENLIPYGRTSSLETSLDENQYLGLILQAHSNR